jgi:hypothetical protein
LYERIPLAASSTGTATHPSVSMGDGQAAMSFKFIVDVAGATPTITWKIQASPDETSVTDANSAWFDLGYITDASDTISQATRTATAVGAQINFLSNPVARVFRKYRLVTSSNTNITYHADAFRVG